MKSKLFLCVLILSFSAFVSADIIVYDGDTKGTDYEAWWNPGWPARTTSFTNTNLSPHSGTLCGKWTATTASGLGAQISDANWAGIDISSLTNIEFWAKGKNGGEAITLDFFTVDPDGAGPLGIILLHVPLTGLTTTWTKYSYNRTYILANKNPDPSAPLTKFEGIQMTSTAAGVIFFDDIVVKTCGGPVGKILNGDDAASSLRSSGTNAEIQFWYGSPRIVVTNVNVVSGSGCEKLSALTNTAEMAVFLPGFGLMDASKNSKLVLWVRGQAGGEGFTFRLRDNNGQFANPVHVSGLTTSWTKVSVSAFDLANGTGFDLSRIQVVDIVWSDGPGTFFIDDMGFPASGDYAVNSASVSPSTITNLNPNVVQFTADISAAGPFGAPATNKAVFVDLSPVGGSRMALTNQGGTLWRGTFTIAVGALTGNHNLVMMVSNSLGDTFKNSTYFPLSVVGIPPVPVLLSAMPESSTSMRVEWADVPMETSYTLFHSTVNDTNTATGPTGFPADTAGGVDPGLTQGNKYFFWIKVYNQFGASRYSSVVSNILDVPAQPAIQYFEATSPTVMVAGWDNLPNETGYTLRFNIVNDITTAVALRLGMNTNTFWSSAYAALQSDRLYYFWVNAFNNVGSSASSFASNWTPPGQPKIFTAFPVSLTNMFVSWTNMRTETSFTLYVNTVKNSNTAQKYYFPLDIDYTTLPGISLGVTYYFWLKTVNPAGTSEFSPVKKFQPVAPVQPVFHSVSPVTATTDQMSVVWYNQGDEFGFKLYRNTVKSTNGATNGLAPMDYTNFLDTGLAPGTKYYYWLKAINLGGWSPLSAAWSNTTLIRPSRPVIAAVTALSTNILALRWIDLPNETSYSLYRNLADDTNTATNIAGLSAGTTRFTNTGLMIQTRYYYWIKAYNSVGVSGFSAAASQVGKEPVRFILPEGDFAIYPNKIDLSAGDKGTIVFSKSATVTVLVYSARGVLVNTIADGLAVSSGDILEWDGSNAAGDPVGAGVYVLVVKGDGITQKPLKFIVIK